MKITDIRCVPVLCRRKRAFGGVTKTALGAAAHSDYTIVFVETDASIVGLGEVDSVFKRRGALRPNRNREFFASEQGICLPRAGKIR